MQKKIIWIREVIHYPRWNMKTQLLIMRCPLCLGKFSDAYKCLFRILKSSFNAPWTMGARTKNEIGIWNRNSRKEKRRGPLNIIGRLGSGNNLIWANLWISCGPPTGLQQTPNHHGLRFHIPSRASERSKNPTSHTPKKKRKQSACEPSRTDITKTLAPKYLQHV